MPEFKKRARYFADLLDSDVVPDRAPSPDECRFRDISTGDYPERVDTFANVDIPTLDW
jgi:hypothetical protein